MKNNPKKQNILDAYAAIIVEQGLEGASVGAVARRLGINQSLIFHYFENKDEMTVTLCREVFNKAVKWYDRVCACGTDCTPEGFETFVVDILRIHKKRSRSIHPKLHFALVYLMPRNVRVHELFTDLSRRASALISSRLDEFTQAGIACSRDSRSDAHTLLCLADGILCNEGLIPQDKMSEFVSAQRDLFFAHVKYSGI